jgi:SAM-dependent methyltransferase
VQDSSKVAASQILNREGLKEVLDAPCGAGWLRDRLKSDVEIDGIDLYAQPRPGYRQVISHNLDHGLPESLPRYDAVVSCEGLEHFANPELFLRHAKRCLKPNGLLMITTPNIWYPASRLQFFARGFFPGFPCLTGRIEPGSHMHIMPWSYPQLYLYLKLSGYRDIQLHDEKLSAAKRWIEKLLALPQKIYCQRKANKSRGEVREFWETAMRPASLYGRHLIVTARI